MKTIAVLIPTFTIEYASDILAGIYDYFDGKDVRVIISQTKFAHSTVGVFDYQHWTSLEFLKSRDIDAYIVVSGVYTSTISKTELEEIVSKLLPRPVISIGVDLSLPGTYSVVTDCNKTFSDLIGHLKNVHGCKKIAFCSANSTKSSEAIERYDAFTLALEEHNLPFYPDLVLDGFFTNFGAKEDFQKHYHSKEDVNFDALVCANDLMAAGCISAMKELGVRIPEDVIVTGFDDAVTSKISKPRLTTINQSVYSLGLKAAGLANIVVNEGVIRKKTAMPLLLKFRQSCGCIDSELSQAIYKDVENNICLDTDESEANLFQFINEMNERNKLITLMDTVRGANTLKQFFYNLRFIADQCDFSSVSVNFYKDVVYLDAEDDFKLPKKMSLCMLYDRDTSTELFKPGVTFNPQEQIVAARSLISKPGIFILHPIFSGESNYGFMLCKIDNKSFANYIVYLKIITTTIAQSYEYTNQIVETQKLESEKSYLTKQSLTDELTQILNRRGFIENGQKELDIMQETDKAGVIFFADIDGLKTINDTYGHEMGDLAIKTEAEVLKSVFRKTDIVGRLSGDEFGIVAIGMKLNHVENVRLKVDLMNEKVSGEKKLPFKLSISLGAVDLQKSSVLKKLLSEADKDLYQEKRKRRHARIS